MLRRTFCRLMAGGSALWHSTAIAAPSSLDPAQLTALAAAVLPASLGQPRLESIARRFELWLAGYNPGAEMEHGYGFTKMAVKPPSPVETYRTQLAAFGPAFAKLPVQDRQ